MMHSPRKVLRQLLSAAIASAQAAHCLPAHIPKPVKGRTFVVGAGKASANMARVFEQHFAASLSGLVVTQAGYAQSCKQIEIIKAPHPMPDAASMDAAQRILDIAHDLGKNDQLVCLISGGGSSLMALPAAEISLEDKQNIASSLLNGGATISEINCVRRHLSCIKGGRLAKAAYPAHVHTLLISDVPGDAVKDIASGPSVADSSSCQDALRVIDQYQIKISETIRASLLQGELETVKADHPCFENSITQIIATPQQALEAAAALATKLEIKSHILSDRLEGEARKVGEMLAKNALKYIADEHRAGLPYLQLSGGETTVTVQGNGKGGRNVECLLAMAIALDGQKNVYALAADTDGIDGREAIAGAIMTPSTLKRASEKGMNPRAYLDNNDAHTFFSQLGDSVITGATLTNVNDFRAILIIEDSATNKAYYF